jgi:hypothetical protein
VCHTHVRHRRPSLTARRGRTQEGSTTARGLTAPQARATLASRTRDAEANLRDRDEEKSRVRVRCRMPLRGMRRTADVRRKSSECDSAFEAQRAREPMGRARP